MSSSFNSSPNQDTAPRLVARAAVASQIGGSHALTTSPAVSMQCRNSQGGALVPPKPPLEQLYWKTYPSKALSWPQAWIHCLVDTRPLSLLKPQPQQSPNSTHVGNGVCVRHTDHASDADTLQDLLRQHHLVAEKKRTSLPRVSAGSGVHGNNQTNFATARPTHSDPKSRTAQPIILALVPACGLHHNPIVGCSPFPKPPRIPRPPNPLSMRTFRDVCLQQPELLNQFSAEVGQVHMLQPQLSAAELLHTAWHYALAAQPIGPPVPPTQIKL